VVLIRATDVALGDDLGGSVVTYVGDDVVHSVCCEDQLRHLNTVPRNSQQQLFRRYIPIQLVS
jgi:hypothetical protein